MNVPTHLAQSILLRAVMGYGAAGPTHPSLRCLLTLSAWCAPALDAPSERRTRGAPGWFAPSFDSPDLPLHLVHHAGCSQRRPVCMPPVGCRAPCQALANSWRYASPATHLSHAAPLGGCADSH